MEVDPIESLGWLATAVFVGSYFFSRAEALRRVQMAGALIWIVYGALIAAPPVVAANMLVLAAAAWTMWRARPAGEPDVLRSKPPWYGARGKFPHIG